MMVIDRVGNSVTVYPYRWVVLASFMLINIMVQVLWICYAPIVQQAADFYQVKTDGIDLLAFIFMLLYIPFSFPAAWAIDHFGFKKAVSFGAVLMGVFGLLRGLFPNNYAIALISAIGISIGQPFLLNAFLKLAATWFPHRQRATITGLMFLAMFLGIGIGEALTPPLVDGLGISGMLMVYGIITAITVALFLLFARNKPPTPASPPDETVRALVLDGLKGIIKIRDFYFLCFVLFVGSGFVNSILTLISGFGKEKGLTIDEGIMVTAAIIFGGIIGSIIIPFISDGLHRRKSILLVSIILVIPASLGLVLGKGFDFEMAMAGLVGFLITGLTPLAYQYGAEITHPAPEGTSNGLFALMVQASGFLILLMDVLKKQFNNSYLPSLLIMVGLLGIGVVMFVFLKESPEMHRRIAGQNKNEV